MQLIREIIPVFIRKEDQILISILPKDFSFVMGDNLSRIFHLFMVHGIKVNLVEASAVSIDVCLDDERPKVDALINDLKSEFSAVYNENVEMLSIRHYTPEALDRITKGREILLEQRTRSTVRFVVRQYMEITSCASAQYDGQLMCNDSTDQLYRHTVTPSYRHTLFYLSNNSLCPL